MRQITQKWLNVKCILTQVRFNVEPKLKQEQKNFLTLTLFFPHCFMHLMNQFDWAVLLFQIENIFGNTKAIDSINFLSTHHHFIFNFALRGNNLSPRFSTSAYYWFLFLFLTRREKKIFGSKKKSVDNITLLIFSKSIKF